MFNYAKKKILFTLLATSLFGGQLSAAALTDTQLHAVMGIITNFILSEPTDTTAPVFTSSATVSVSENQTDAIVLSTTDASGVTYSLSGTDAAFFTVGASTGVVTFNTIPDYETRTSYTFTATATDVAGNSTSQEIVININDYFQPFNVAVIDDTNDNSFGTSVASDGVYSVVGGNDYVSLYKKDDNDTMHFIRKFQADDTTGSYEFGASVAIYGEYIVVGDPTNYYDIGMSGYENGSAYVYKINSSDDTVTQIAVLFANTLQTDSEFGVDVDIDENYIVVGAAAENGPGSAYLYELNTGNDTVSFVAKVSSANLNAYDNFGNSVAISGNHFVVGALSTAVSSSAEGVAYVYEIDTVLSEINSIGLLYSTHPADSNFFARDVDISGDYIVVSDENSDVDAVNSGAAQLFKIDTATSTVSHLSTILPSSSAASDSFGKQVAIKNNLIAVSSSQLSEVYLFNIDADTDAVTQNINLPKNFEVNKENSFGKRLALSNESILVGAKGERGVYVYSLEPTDRLYVLEEPSLTKELDEESTLDIQTIYIYTLNNDHQFTISGDDAANFNITDNVLRMNTAFDYENPTDIDDNNSYEISVEVQSTLSQTLSYDMVFTIKDREVRDIQKLQADIPLANAKFGTSVAQDGNYSVVGSSGNNSAYVYKRESNATLTQIAHLQGDSSGNNYGGSVSIEGEYIVVTASSENTHGVAYLYKIDTNDNNVSFLQKIEDSNLTTSASFGFSSTIKDTYILIGAINANTTVNKAGAVYMYELNTTSDTAALIDILSSEIPASNANFGRSIVMDNNYILVGAGSYDSASYANMGAAYLYKFNENNKTVTQLNLILADDGLAGDAFGAGLAMQNGNILIGAPDDDTTDNRVSAGSVYLYKLDISNDTLTFSAKYTLDNPRKYDQFATSIALDGTNVLVSSRFDDETGIITGKVYLYKLNEGNHTMTQVDGIKSFDIEESDDFGKSLSLQGSSVLIGATREDTNGNNAGSVYVFELE